MGHLRHGPRDFSSTHRIRVESMSEEVGPRGVRGDEEDT